MRLWGPTRISAVVTRLRSPPLTPLRRAAAGAGNEYPWPCGKQWRGPGQQGTAKQHALFYCSMHGACRATCRVRGFHMAKPKARAFPALLCSQGLLFSSPRPKIPQLNIYFPTPEAKSIQRTWPCVLATSAARGALPTAAPHLSISWNTARHPSIGPCCCLLAIYLKGPPLI